MTYGQVRGDFIFASSCGVKINFKNQYYDLSLGLDNIGFSKSTYFSDNSYSSKGIKWIYRECKLVLRLQLQ